MSTDAELIALGERLHVAWNAEKEVFARRMSDAECEVAMDACDAIIDEIWKIPATTLAGLKVKALALVPYLGDDEPDGDDPLADRLLASLLTDLRAM